MRPVIVSTPPAGEVALSLPIPHGGVLYLAQVAWRRGDPLETTDVLLDPELPVWGPIAKWLLGTFDTDGEVDGEMVG